MLLCLILLGLGSAQGPRVRFSNIGSLDLAGAPNQRLLLHTSQVLGSITSKAVSISPKTPISAVGNGATVAVLFTKPLDNNTDYTITIRPKHMRTVQYHFTTALPTLYLVHRPRADQLGDKIIEHQLGTGKERTVFSAKNITDFITLNNTLIVSTRNQDFTNTIYKVDIRSGRSTTLPMPTSGTVARLQSAPNRLSYGLCFTSKTTNSKYNNTLYIGSLSSAKLTLVEGLGGQPLQTANWRFGPDSNSIISQLFDNSTLLGSLAAGSTPVPLGQLALGGIEASGKQAIFTDSQGLLSLDIATNRQHRLPQPNYGSQSFLIDATPLNSSDGYILHGEAQVADHYIEYLATGHGASQQRLLTTNKNQSVAALQVSPNDGYLAADILQTVNGNNTRFTQIFNLATRRSATLKDLGSPHWQ